MPHQLSRMRSDGRELPVGDLLEALRNDKRRSVLRLLVASDGTMGVQELADEMTLELDSPIEDSDTIAAELHHNHLPRLDSIGVITYDTAENVAVPIEPIEELAPFLEYLEAKRNE